MNAEAFHCLWYICPQCFQANVMQIYSPFFPHNIRCKGCATHWQVEELFASAVDPDGEHLIPSDDKISYVVQFMCDDCGYENTVFRQPTKETERIGPYKVHSVSYGMPVVGRCEDCGEEYDLVYPIPEVLERPRNTDEG